MIYSLLRLISSALIAKFMIGIDSGISLGPPSCQASAKLIAKSFELRTNTRPLIFLNLLPLEALTE